MAYRFHHAWQIIRGLDLQTVSRFFDTEHLEVLIHLSGKAPESAEELNLW